MGEGVEVWRGSVAVHECDSMGHMSVGNYAAKAMEALIGLAAELGMPGAFAPHAEATLLLRDLHVRYRREAHAGARLSIDAGVIAMGEDDARLLFLMRHADGALAAAFQTRVAHVTAREGRAFPWPDWARVRAEALRIEVPADAEPRSVPLEPMESQANRERAHDLGLRRIGLGAVRPDDCDPFGRVRPDVLTFRASMAAAHLFADLLAQVPGEKVGAVMLEHRFLYLAWPKIGDRFEVRSGFSGAEPRLRRMVHWILDPHTGRPWAAMEGVAACFDVAARKMIALDETQLAVWSKLVVPGLSI